MLPERSNFLTEVFTEDELSEIGEVPHSQLLDSAYREITQELDMNGHSKRFHELRRAHARKLITYWGIKYQQYQLAQREGWLKTTFNGEALITGNEELVVRNVGVYEQDDEHALRFERHTPTEEDEVTIIISDETGLDEYRNPPTIKSKISSDPEIGPDTYYTVVFRQGRISTFERTLLHHDPTNTGHYIKDTRKIDCSIFGVELPLEERP